MEWSDVHAFGNTMSNLFSGITDMEFASMYRRSSQPSNSVCKKYYKISYSSVAKNFFTPKKIGSYFELNEKKADTVATRNSEKKAIAFMHKFHLNKIVYFLVDAIFATKKWENDRFRKFINDFNPDIVFSFTSASKTHLLFINTIKKYAPNCKHVSFIVDDNYAIFNSKKYKKIISAQLKQASKVYAITPSLKRKYEDIFDVEIDILTKGCEFSYLVKEKNNPVKTIVYAGNLLYGREKTLAKLAMEIKKHNDCSDNKLMLKIYSPTILDDSTAKTINIDGASEFLGAKAYNEIVEIMRAADVVLHVESFDEEQQKVVKHSFSTKITDCMQSGSVLFSIGPEGLASIEATKNIDGTFCAVNIEEIEMIIKQIADADLYENAKSIRAYAEKNFDIKKIQKKIVEDFRSII